MKTNTTNTATRSDNTLESLPAEKRQWVLELASRASLLDVADVLREEGIHVSPPTLSRFVRRDRERRLLDDREEMAATVTELAAGAKESKFREGTIEALRQRIYERALVSRDPEEARELFAAAVKEEAKLREIELEARRVEIAEEELKLQRAKLELEARKAAEKERIKATVTGSEAVVETAALSDGKMAPQLPERRGERERVVKLLTELDEILNRGGEVGERIAVMREMVSEGLADLRKGGVIDD